MTSLLWGGSFLLPSKREIGKPSLRSIVIETVLRTTRITQAWFASLRLQQRSLSYSSAAVPTPFIMTIQRRCWRRRARRSPPRRTAHATHVSPGERGSWVRDSLYTSERAASRRTYTRVSARMRSIRERAWETHESFLRALLPFGGEIGRFNRLQKDPSARDSRSNLFNSHKFYVNIGAILRFID